MLIFHAEMGFACLYAMRNPTLARDCAQRALTAALAIGRPDLALEANYLLATLERV